MRRASLRVGDRAVRARAEFSLSEALRMVRLAGEDEGRVYYFRRVWLAGVPADGNRMLWQAQLQRALDRLAQAAVHGAEPHAGNADAVYFCSRQEALEVLLRHVVRGDARDQWFWPLVSTAAPDAGRSVHLVAILEALRQEPGSWCRVARTVFAGCGSADPVAMVAALPLGVVVTWLRELGAGGASDPSAAAVRLAPDVQSVLLRAREGLGATDPRVVWLAALAVAATSPSAIESGVTGAASPRDAARAGAGFCAGVRAEPAAPADQRLLTRARRDANACGARF